MNSWGQDNSFPKVFTQAAKVGYPAQTIIDRLKQQITQHSVANLRISDGNHGLEKAGAIEALNSMLLQSWDGLVQVFPVWPAGKSRSFHHLREKGGLVVSASRTGDAVEYITVTSEQGGVFEIKNPWTGTKVNVSADNGTAGNVGAGKSTSARQRREGRDVHVHTPLGRPLDRGPRRGPRRALVMSLDVCRRAARAWLRVRAHETVQAGRRELRPPGGPGPHPLLEGADRRVQVGGGRDGLGEFGALQHRQVRAHPSGGIRWAASPRSVTPGTWAQVWGTGRTYRGRRMKAVPWRRRSRTGVAHPSNRA